LPPHEKKMEIMIKRRKTRVKFIADYFNDKRHSLLLLSCSLSESEFCEFYDNQD